MFIRDSYLFAKDNHSPRAVQRFIRDLVRLQLEGFQLGEWGPIINLTLCSHCVNVWSTLSQSSS